MIFLQLFDMYTDRSVVQKQLLCNVVERVVVNVEVKIERINLWPPFLYLHDVCTNVCSGEANAENTLETKQATFLPPVRTKS